jgi:outer membrane lipoprotein-sorting protein
MKWPAHSIAIVSCLVFLAGAGCAKSRPALPAVEWDGTGDAVRILADRAKSVRTVSATGLLTLTRPDGESIRFDAALVTAPPDRLRLRAWKIGRAVFDLTLTPDGLWLLSPQDPSLRDKVKSAGVGAGEIARQWSLLSGEFFQRDDLAHAIDANDLVLTAKDAGPIIRCYVDKRTLVPRRYVLQDAGGRSRFTLKLGDYRMIGDTPYPHDVWAKSESGAIRVRLAEVELNTQLAPAAFQPPRRAEKIESP